MSRQGAQRHYTVDAVRQKGKCWQHVPKLKSFKKKLHREFHEMFESSSIPLVCEIWDANRDGWENQCLSKLFNNDYFWTK